MKKQNQVDKLTSFLKQFEEECNTPGDEMEGYHEGFVIKGRQSAISTEIMRRFRIQNIKLLKQVAILKEQLKYANKDRDNILDTIKVLARLNKELSEALGSCPECWGENASCTTCKGSGIPGWKTINKRHFNNYVLPALEIVEHTKRRKRS